MARTRTRGRWTTSVRTISLLALAALSLVHPGCGGNDPPSALVVPPASPGAIRAAIAFAGASRADAAQDWAESRRQCQAALDADPHHNAARMQLAWACWNLHEYDMAADLYGQVRGPLAKSAKLWRAHSLAAAGQWNDAQEAYAQDLSQAVPVSWAPYALPGSPKADNVDRCIVSWKKIASENPKSPVAQWLLGNTFIAAQRWDDSRAAYDKALALAPAWEPAIISSAFNHANAGRHAQALALLDPLLQKQPGHVSALWARAYARKGAGNDAGACDDFAALFKTQGRAADAAVLIDAAVLAWKIGRLDEGVAQLNAAILWASAYPRAVLLPGNREALLQFTAGNAPGSTTSALGRYAFASALFELIDATLNATGLALLADNSLEQINTPTEADRAPYLAQSLAAAEEAARNFDMSSAFASGMRGRVLPHTGRCIRELQQALQDRPDFEAAKVLLAQIHWYIGNADQARLLLQEVLAARPDATSIRVRLSTWTTLDKAQELMETIDAQDAQDIGAVFRRARLCQQVGDAKACTEQSLAILRDRGNFWDIYEMLGLSLQQTGAPDDALACLEFSVPLGRTADGALARAKLRAQLSKPAIVEGLIDAWRSASAGTPPEAEARELLRHRDTGTFVCGRCGGGGTISVTNGDIGQYSGTVATTQASCPQCLGLGLWHPNVP